MRRGGAAAETRFRPAEGNSRLQQGDSAVPAGDETKNDNFMNDIKQDRRLEAKTVCKFIGNK